MHGVDAQPGLQGATQCCTAVALWVEWFGANQGAAHLQRTAMARWRFRIVLKRRFPFDTAYRAQRLCRHMLNVLAAFAITMDSQVRPHLLHRPGCRLRQCPYRVAASDIVVCLPSEACEGYGLACISIK